MKKLPIDSDQAYSKPTDSENCFLSPRHQQLYQKLITGFCEGKILFTLTGESGLGKTFLMEHIARGLGVSTQLIKIQRSNTNYDEFFDSIGKESGIDLTNESTLAEKVACLTRCFRAQSERHIIIEIDHAQKIKPDTLGTIFNWVKLIGSEQDHSSYIHIVLIGLPALDGLLKQSGLRKLDSELVCQYSLEPLSDDEIQDYINFHLNQTDDNASRFEQNALEKIAYYSKGNPGLINKLCDLGLLTASLDQNPTVTSSDIDEVADNCMLSLSKITLNENSPSALEGLQSKTNKPATARKTPETLLTQLLSGKNPLPFINENNSEKETVVNNPRLEEVTILNNKTKNAPTFSEPVTVLRAKADKKFPSEPEPVTIRRDELEDSILNSPERNPTQSKTVITQRYDHDGTIPYKAEKFSSPNEPTAPRKGFITGLLIGLLVSIAGLVFMNMDRIFYKDEDPSQIVSDDNIVKLEQPQQNIRIAKSTAKSISAEQNQKFDNLKQPLQDSPDIPTEITHTGIQKITDPTDTDTTKITEDLPKQPTITKVAKADEIKNQRINKFFEQANQQLVKKQLMTPGEDNAWQTYQDILSLDPGNELALAGLNKISETYVMWAREEVRKENFSHAEYLFNKALKVSPDNKDALLGLSNFANEQPAIAQKPSTIGNKPNPKQSVSSTSDTAELFALAEQQLAKKQLMTPAEDSAWHTYQNILKIEPDNEKARAGIDKISKTYVLWAREEIKKDNPVHAEYLFNRALEASPENKDALSGLSSLGKKPKVLDQPSSAISGQPFDKKQTTNTTDLFELLNRAELQLENKQLMLPVDNNAWNTYQQILSLDPGNVQALAGINKIGKTYILWAWLDIKKGNFQKAKFHFNKALEVSPGDVDALSGLDWLAKNS